VLETVTGKQLEGTEYEPPLQKHMSMPQEKNGFRVVLSDRFVTVEDGTGLVHTAPGFGKEDFEVGQKNGLPLRSPINLDGSLKPETGKYAGKKARVVDAEIIEDLRADNLLVYSHAYSHDYPVCWRDKSPLLQMSVPQWFFAVSKMREQLLKHNESVKWVPERMKGRMRGWLEGLSDWPVSRSRYWGTPLPIWVCQHCDSKTVVGSRAELAKLVQLPADMDLHKPWIDEIVFKCQCGGVKRRVPFVLDVWFDSGVSSWAALGYPADQKKFKEFWPADFNIEGTDQFRGWWNSQLICSQICFGEKPFKTVSVHGLVLDLGKKKMSKSQGNIVAPSEVIAKYSRDYLRYYLASESKGDDFVFDWKRMEDIHRFFSILWNSYNYAALYLDLDFASNTETPKGVAAVEDRWLLSRLQATISECEAAFESYEFFRAARALESFVVEDLSRTYIKLVRDRAKEDPKTVSKVLSHALFSVIRLLSPLCPHASEHFFLHGRSEKMPMSVHLTELPVAQPKSRDADLETEFAAAQSVLQVALSVREEQKKKLRWPLRELVVVTETGKRFSKVLSVLESQANVKKAIELKAKPADARFAWKESEGNIWVGLDVSADAALEDEWEYMELRRLVQDARKTAKLLPDQLATLEIACSDDAFLQHIRKQLEQECRVKTIAGKGDLVTLVNRGFFIRLNA
jgi:isoleucyl-tRNA synthetase